MNRVSFTLSEADLEAIQGALHVLQDKLLPHLVTLDPEERRELPRMGDKTVAFVRKSADYAAADGSLVPSYLDLAELQRDLKAVDDLLSLQRPLAQLLAGLEDTIAAAGSEAYAGALAYYQAVKGAARMKVPGAEVIADDLRQRFPGRSRGRPRRRGESARTPARAQGRLWGIEIARASGHEEAVSRNHAARGRDVGMPISPRAALHRDAEDCRRKIALQHLDAEGSAGKIAIGNLGIEVRGSKIAIAESNVEVRQRKIASASRGVGVQGMMAGVGQRRTFA